MKHVLARHRERWYQYRFEIFFASQLCIMFGSLFFTSDFSDNALTGFFEDQLLPFLFLANIAAGIFFLSHNKILPWVFVVIFTLSAFTFGVSVLQHDTEKNGLLKLGTYSIFYVIVTYQIILQVWNEKKVGKAVIIGLMSGYLALGFLAFCLFMIIELIMPGSFFDISPTALDGSQMHANTIMYYAYVTLLTIGYGEIIPITPVAQKASVLVGLMGQFYIVILTSIIVGKYIQHNISAPKQD